jgi:uncharacterized protein YprB with RNaseH-like and TPR domain
MSPLTTKLRSLRADAGAHGKADPRPNLAQLAARIERLQRRASGRGDQIERALGMRLMSDGVLVRRQELPLALVGRLPNALHALLGSAHIAEDLLFLDTETSGLAGGSGTMVFLIGLGRIRGDSLHLVQWLLSAPRGEAAMLADALDFARGCECIVSYNGKSFDLPLLAARLRLNRMTNPWVGSPHIDLLHHVRRLFAGIWADCRLASAEEHLLGLVRVDDIAGARVPEIWRNFVRYGDMREVPAVLEHNRQDVLSLYSILGRLDAIFRAPPADLCLDARRLARAYAKAGMTEAVLPLLLDRAEGSSTAARLMLAECLHRHGRESEAVAQWEVLAQGGVRSAAQRLARFYERCSGDFGRAYQWAEALCAAGTAGDLRRRDRLRDKLSRVGAASETRQVATNLDPGLGEILAAQISIAVESSASSAG